MTAITSYGNDTGPDLTEEKASATNDKLDDLLSGEQIPEEKPVTEEPEAETPVEPEVDEGPSIAMRAVARQANIPQKLVDFARDDAQLQELVDLASQEDSRPPPPEPEPAFELSLPDDEYGEDDAIRKQFAKMKDHYSGQIDSLHKNMNTMVDVLQTIEGDQRSQSEHQAAVTQDEFDRSLDELNDPTFGKSGDLRRAQTKMRSAACDELPDARKGNRGTSEWDLAKLAAVKAVPSTKYKNKAATQRIGIQEQNRRKLGAGNSKPAPDPDLTPEQNFMKRFDERFGT